MRKKSAASQNARLAQASLVVAGLAPPCCGLLLCDRYSGAKRLLIPAVASRCWLSVSCELSACSFARRIGRSANMQMTQIPQRRLIFVAHSARGLRHILQYAQSLPNRLPPILRHLLPLRQHIIPNMTLLLRRQPAPLLSS